MYLHGRVSKLLSSSFGKRIFTSSAAITNNTKQQYSTKAESTTVTYKPSEITSLEAIVATSPWTPVYFRTTSTTTGEFPGCYGKHIWDNHADGTDCTMHPIPWDGKEHVVGSDDWSGDEWGRAKFSTSSVSVRCYDDDDGSCDLWATITYKGYNPDGSYSGKTTTTTVYKEIEGPDWLTISLSGISNIVKTESSNITKWRNV